MCPSPQHAGGLPASEVTGLQAARSFFGDFLDFVSNAAIEYRSTRGLMFSNEIRSTCATLHRL